MNNKASSLALAAIMAGAAGTANAVNVNPDGKGQVLLYPLYSVEGGQDTYFSVTNTTNQAKAVKVRFKEGMNSQEVLDFNLYLSANDMWTATITGNESGPARLNSQDNSCTVPSIPSGGVAFRSAEYEGDADLASEEEVDGAVVSPERTREGYVEVIEMGVVDVDAATASGGDPNLEMALTHSGGTPNNCGALVQAWRGGGVWANDANDQINSPTGGLYGTGVVVNVPQGTGATYDARALANFYTDQPPFANLHRDPGGSSPTLDDAAPSDAIVIGNEGTSATTLSFGGQSASSIRAVSAALTRSDVQNDYVLDKANGAGTDWVVTFPTKKTHTNPNLSSALPPFTTLWNGVRACEPIGLTVYDREEQADIPDTLDFSPRPSQDGFQLCKEVNVLTFDESNVLSASSRIGANLDVADGFENGWVDMSFDQAGQTATDDDGDTIVGLPVIGFAVQKFVNGNLGGGTLANYAGVVNHKYERTISGAQSPG